MIKLTKNKKILMKRRMPWKDVAFVAFVVVSVTVAAATGVAMMPKCEKCGTRYGKSQGYSGRCPVCL